MAVAGCMYCNADSVQAHALAVKAGLESIQHPGSSWTESGSLTPSIAFRHLPPNSARFSYASEGAGTLYLCAAIQRRGQRPPKGSGTNMTHNDCRSNLAPKHARKHETHSPRVKEFRLGSNDCGFICAGVSFVGGYK